MLNQNTKSKLLPGVEVIDLEPLSDDEIYQMAVEDWLGVLAKLWTAYDKPLDSERLGLYRDMLNQVPLGLLETAIGRVVREHKYNSVPTVAEVWAAVHKELGNPQDIDSAIEFWCESRWNAALYRGAVTAVTEEMQS